MNDNERQARINALMQLLKNTDYQAIKHSEGAIYEDDYSEIKEQRQAWRDEINQLESSGMRNNQIVMA